MTETKNLNSIAKSIIKDSFPYSETISSFLNSIAYTFATSSRGLDPEDVKKRGYTLKKPKQIIKEREKDE